MAKAKIQAPLNPTSSGLDVLFRKLFRGRDLDFRLKAVNHAHRDWAQITYLEV